MIVNIKYHLYKIPSKKYFYVFSSAIILFHPYEGPLILFFQELSQVFQYSTQKLCGNFQKP